MSDTLQQLIQGVVIPAASLLATGIVGWLVSRLRTRTETVNQKVEENTKVTVAAANDQSVGFKDIGQWRYKVNERMARQEERLRQVEDRLNQVHGRVERIPTESQHGYRREMEETPLSHTPKPWDAPPVVTPVRRKK